MKKLILFFGLILIASGCAQQPVDNNVNSDETGVYATQEECETTTGSNCSYETCEVIPEGQTIEGTCGVSLEKGWRNILENTENVVDEEGVDEMRVVENGDTVKVEYVGKYPESGEVFDKSEGRGPLEFVAGAGQMIVGFDKAVIGMKLNEEKTVTIPPEDAYGLETQRIQIPIEQIQGGGITPEVGAKVGNNAGQQGEIVEINDGIAVIEFPNTHQLAGKTLQFWIKVVEIVKK